jgi:hypothetical protein
LQNGESILGDTEVVTETIGLEDAAILCSTRSIDIGTVLYGQGRYLAEEGERAEGDQGQLIEATLNEGHCDCGGVGRTSVEYREEDEVLKDGQRVSVPDGGCKPYRIDQSRYPIESMAGAGH